MSRQLSTSDTILFVIMREIDRKRRALMPPIKPGFGNRRGDTAGKFQHLAVNHERPRVALILRHSDQRCIGRLHWQVAVFSHQLAYAWAIVATEFDHQLKSSHTQLELVWRIAVST